VQDLVLDNEGNIWVATNKGLYCLFQLYFKNYAVKNDIIRCAIEKNDGKILFGSLNGVLGLIDPASSYSISTKNYTPSKYGAAFFYSYGCALKDKVYLPGPGDILAVQGNNSNWLNLPFYDPYMFVNRLNDSLFIAGGPELILLFIQSGKLLKTYNNNSRSYFGQLIYTIPYTDNENRIWLGGEKGISILKNEESYKKIFNKQLSKIKAMGKDMQNQIWIGSENRLFRSEGDTVKFVRKFNSLITNIFFTRNGFAIFCTMGGIYIFDKDLTHYSFYNHNNGFTGREPFEANLAEDSLGNVYLPTLEALVSFNPQQLFTKQSPPKLYIQSLSVSSDNIHWQKTDTLHLNLSHTQKNIRFSYIGLSYSQAQNVRYQYRLLGFQNQWSNPVSEREVTFNNLPPAKYTFQLKASAGTEETQTDTISLPFEITPAFWQTWWFWTLAIVIMVGCLTWIIFTYLKKKQLENIKRIEREKEMNELRVQSVRLKSIPHFNSNVLASIEYYMMAKSKEESNQLLTRYSRFTNITLHEIDKANRSLKDEIDYVRLYLELEKLRFGDKFSYSIDVDENTDTEIRIPNMVLHTYAENAVKHGIRGKNTPGHVSIKATSEKKGVLLSVEDDGIGREECRRRDPDREGHGLRILTRQIELYNQQNAEKIVQTVIDLKDDEGNAAGTRFEMFVPSEYKYL